jgi:hypothetical protein
MQYPFCDTQYLATWLRVRRSRKDNHEARSNDHDCLAVLYLLEARIA